MIPQISTQEVYYQHVSYVLEDTLRISLTSYHTLAGQSDYPRTLQDSIICMFNILYERVDDGLALVYWCII